MHKALSWCDNGCSAAVCCHSSPRGGPAWSGIEACGSAHHWARELVRLGHEVRLIPPSYVKPYVKHQKNDMADAEAICEAVTRPAMRFVPVKSPEQQSVMVLH